MALVAGDVDAQHGLVLDGEQGPSWHIQWLLIDRMDVEDTQPTQTSDEALKAFEHF